MKRFIRNLLLLLCVIAALLAAVYFFLPGTAMEAMTQAARWHAGVELREVTVDDYTWPYLTGGKGDTVIMLHGFGMSKDLWNGLLPAMTARYHVVAPDLPGFGGNTKIMTDSYDIPRQAKRLEKFVEKIGITKFYLIGFSMGGGIAGYYAGEHPGQVKGLILIDAFGVIASRPSDFDKFRTKNDRVLIYKNVGQLDTLLSYGYHRPPKIPAQFKRHFAEIGAKNYNFYLKIFDTLSSDPNILGPRLPLIRAKTLILWGDRDRILDVSAAEKMKNGIRGSKLVIIGGSGHNSYAEKPDETNKAIVDFLSGI